MIKILLLFSFFSFPIVLIAGEGNSLTMLTLNVKQFPYNFLSTDNDSRAILLTEVIKAQHQEFDVIAFQELWSSQGRKLIYDNIQSLYPFKYEDQGWGAVLGLGLNSGLAIYSKYPIKRGDKHLYKNFRGPEHFAQKGIIGVELNVLGRTVYLFTTHLQGGTGGGVFEWFDRNEPATDKISALELREAREFIDGFLALGTGPVFFVGDFNITAGNEEYEAGLKELKDATDTFDPRQSQYIGTDWASFPSDHRIDYILTLGHKVEGHSKVVDIFGKDITDHLGMIGVFDLSGFPLTDGQL